METVAASSHSLENGASSKRPAPQDATTSSISSSELNMDLIASGPSRPNLAARHAKRLTLNFPIIPPPSLRSDQSSPSPGVTTPATEASLNFVSGRPASIAPSVSEDSTEGTDILTAVASQERKVLELREELQRAENELTNLKRQWALSERTRKRTEINHNAEIMKPMKALDSVKNDDQSNRFDENTVTATDNSTATQVRISREIDRRNSILATAKGDVSISSNGRRVFAGSKHARTLSLLSPDLNPSFKPLPPQRTSTDLMSTENEPLTRQPRSATLPSVERDDPSRIQSPDSANAEGSSSNPWRKSVPPPSREVLLRTGRQMASDLKDGLWTFLEDIRQATVGEEGISATSSRSMHLQSPQPRSSSKRLDRSVTPSRSREPLGSEPTHANSTSSPPKEKMATTQNADKRASCADVSSSFWQEFGVDAPNEKSKKPSSQKHSSNEQRKASGPDMLAVDDNWDSWDTPQPVKMHTPSSSRSTIESKHDQSPSTQLSSPRTSTSFGDWQPDQLEPIPDTNASDGLSWPTFSKFSPAKLTKTASNLMDEWERSLSSTSDRDLK